MKDLYIGLLSGTSMDGIDAGLVEFDEQQCQLLARYHYPYPTELCSQLHMLCQPGYDEINRLGQLDKQLGELFGFAVGMLLSQAQIDPKDIKAIGSHGQTIRHRPDGDSTFTLQIADANVIAQFTGITTVADFRRRDIAVGGQGAPLTPSFHRHFFHSASENRVIINIGGISNISILPADGDNTICGFDTGPGNTLLDQWIKKHLQKPYDDRGEWAASGTVRDDLLQVLLSNPYFQQAPPKSTGKEHFHLNWLQKYTSAFSATDVQTTLTELTALTIANAIKQQCPAPAHLIICGGGIHNDFLQQRLKQQLTAYQINSSAELGIDPDWVEAMAFAWFAKQTMEKKPIDLTQITGADCPVILGGIYI